MKTAHLKPCAVKAAFLFSLILSSQSVFGQTNFSTDPVGLIQLSVVGGSVAAPKISLVSPTLTQPVSYQGLITAISGTAITVGGTPWNANQFNGAAGSYYVEIVSTATAAISGTLSDITATTTSTIATAQPTGAAIGDSIKIRKDITISDLFGANNSAGLLATGDASSSDEVLIYNGATAASYYYYTDASHLYDGWYDLSFNPAGQVTIAPNEGVVIKRKAAASLSIVFNGAVKTGNTLIPILNGLNVLGTASAKGLTLDTSGLYTGNPATGVLASNDASTADQIILYSNGGATQSLYYYYTDASHSFDGWYDLSFNPAGSIPISPGTAFVLKRYGGGNAFNWVLPSPTSF